jgi:hypothetical protein
MIALFFVVINDTVAVIVETSTHDVKTLSALSRRRIVVICISVMVNLYDDVFTKLHSFGIEGLFGMKCDVPWSSDPDDLDSIT